MKKSTIIRYTTIVLSMLFLTTTEHSVAEQTEMNISQCLLEVREAMTREEIKQLYSGDQKKINEKCEQGDVDGAVRSVERYGAMNRCVQGLDAHIKSNNLDVTKDVHSQAMSRCRRGDLQSAIEQVSATPTKIPASPAKIISFVTSTKTVKRGSPVTLSWRTENAGSVMLGTFGKNDLLKVRASGSQSVSPDKTTTYILMVGQSAKGPTTMISKKLQIAVSTPPNGTCSIEGKLYGGFRQPVQEKYKGPTTMWTVDIGIYFAGSNSPIKGASVSDRGIYRFNDLSAGETYTVRPSWDSTPREKNVSCEPGKTSTGPKFTITGRPRID